MWPAIAIVAGLVLVAMWVSRVNSRYEEKNVDRDDSPDARVASAWDDFGLADEVAQVGAAVDALVAEAPVARLEQKNSLTRIGLMAIRGERYDVLRAAARRARKLDADCAETTALRALALAYRSATADADDEPSDDDRLRRMLEKARTSMAGCASCSTDMDARILAQEVAIAWDAHFGGDVPATSSEPTGDDVADAEGERDADVSPRAAESTARTVDPEA